MLDLEPPLGHLHLCRLAGLEPLLPVRPLLVGVGLSYCSAEDLGVVQEEWSAVPAERFLSHGAADGGHTQLRSKLTSCCSRAMPN